MSATKQSVSGKKLKFFSCLPLFAAMFFLAGTAKGNINASSAQNQFSAEDTTVYEHVDIMPEYPGGEKALMHFISSTVKYPQSAKDADIQDRVMVGFVISKDGNIRDIKILKGDFKELNDAAMDCIKKMPRWAPGQQDKKNVAVRIVIPFVFKLK